MKKCPQCSTVYEEEIRYCLKDGNPLDDWSEPVSETVEIEDDESETIIRNHPPAIDFSNAERERGPIVIDFSKPETSQEEPETPPVVTIVKEKKEKSGYGFMLFIGLLLGGAMVVAGMFLARNFFGGNNAANSATEERININVQSGKKPTTKNPTPAETVQTASAKHESRTAAPDSEFNGRVITLNAYVRSAANRNASEVDILPMNDRINIGERENPNSPWYKVICEHGVTGWMHGDTIEFTN